MSLPKLPVAHGQQPPFPLLPVRGIPEIHHQEFLIDGLIPRYPNDGTAGYLFAPEKARKSMLIADMALSVATGTSALNRYRVDKQGSVAGFFAEDPAAETSRRIHRIARGRGIEVPDNLSLINVTALALDNADHQQRLMATLQAIPDLSFVWFDPMVRLHSKNDNRAEELGPIHTFLRTLARSCPGAVILLAHHMNKDGGARGSTDFPAFGDFNLYARKVDDNTTDVYRIENRGGPPLKGFRFSIEDGDVEAGPTMCLVASTLGDIDQPEERSARIEEEIIAFRLENPGAAGREALEHLRKIGHRIKDSDFWKAWKNGRP